MPFGGLPPIVGGGAGGGGAQGPSQARFAADEAAPAERMNAPSPEAASRATEAAAGPSETREATAVIQIEQPKETEADAPPKAESANPLAPAPLAEAEAAVSRLRAETAAAEVAFAAASERSAAPPAAANADRTSDQMKAAAAETQREAVSPDATERFREGLRIVRDAA